MNKFTGITALTLLLFSNYLSAVTNEEFNLGNTIYAKAYGQGCGSCHSFQANPQLANLIQNGELDLQSFSETLKKGKNTMPKAIDQIMALRSVKNNGLAEDQAIRVLYKYLQTVNPIQLTN